MPKKGLRGLPTDFDLNLPTDKPVHLGDYLDEDSSNDPSSGASPRFTSEAAPKPAPPSSAQNLEIASQYDRERGYFSRQQLRSGGVPRKQLNLNPETMRMLDDLLSLVRQQSAEKDVRASELFHAMVLSVYEARAHLDFSAVPRRGQWGSPTAAAFPIALKNAFMDAISRARNRK